MALTHIENIWRHLQHLVITQYRESRNLLSLTEKVTGCFQDIEDSSFRLSHFADVEIAEGEWLDIIGKLRNIKRETGESDDDYRARLKVQFRQSSAGTPQNIIQNAADLSQDPCPQYLDETDAVFFIYTPEGEQLSRALVNRLAPAGVLGLPGAAIDVGGDCILADARGKLMLMVAEDSNIESENAIGTETGAYLTTETGWRILLE